MDIQSQIELYLRQCGLAFDPDTVATIADRLPTILDKLDKLDEDVDNPYLASKVEELENSIQTATDALEECVAMFDSIAVKLNEFDFTDGSYDSDNALMTAKSIRKMADDGATEAQYALRRM